MLTSFLCAHRVCDNFWWFFALFFHSGHVMASHVESPAVREQSRYGGKERSVVFEDAATHRRIPPPRVPYVGPEQVRK